MVPYENTAVDGSEDDEESLKQGKPVATNKAKSQTKNGNGCCPGQTGQTGDHILPDSMVDGAGCPGHDCKKAPTICLEAQLDAHYKGCVGKELKANSVTCCKKTETQKPQTVDNG